MSNTITFDGAGSGCGKNNNRVFSDPLLVGGANQFFYVIPVYVLWGEPLEALPSTMNIMTKLPPIPADLNVRMAILNGGKPDHDAVFMGRQDVYDFEDGKQGKYLGVRYLFATRQMPEDDTNKYTAVWSTDGFRVTYGPHLLVFKAKGGTLGATFGPNV